MPCPRWSSTATTRRQRRTALGDPRFNCRACGRHFHERPARRSTIARTRRISSGAPCWGVSGPRSASAPSSRSCSSEATQSRPSRSGTGRAAARRSGRTRSGPSAAAAPGSPGPSMRPPCRARAAGATYIGPSIARGPSSIRGGGRSATRMPPGASCGAWWTWPSASPSVSRRTRIRRTAERSADPGENGAAPMQSIPEHPHRAKPAGHQAAR